MTERSLIGNLQGLVEDTIRATGESEVHRRSSVLAVAIIAIATRSESEEEAKSLASYVSDQAIRHGWVGELSVAVTGTYRVEPWGEAVNSALLDARYIAHDASVQTTEHS